MCGRYLIDDEAYADLLQILNDINAIKKASGINNLSHIDNLAKGEIFPSGVAPVIGTESIDTVKWGFPHWQNPSVIINARSETALEKRMFSKPIRQRRCVVPSCGFFEWSHRSDLGSGNTDRTGLYDQSAFESIRSSNTRKRKSKYLLRHPGRHLLYMAGFISIFKDELGVEYAAFVILTTAASESVAPIHDRMPLILERDEIDLWNNDERFMYFALQRPGPELTAVLDSHL